MAADGQLAAESREQQNPTNHETDKRKRNPDLAACVVLLAKGIRKDGGNQVQEQVRPVVRDHT